MFQGVMQAMKDIILEAVGHEYSQEIKDKILGLLIQTPSDMLNYLRSHRGALDFTDTKTLLAKCNGEWDRFISKELKRQKGLTQL